MTFHFLCNFWSCKLQQVAKKAQLRVVCSGPSNTEQMNPYHFCDFLPKSSNPKPSSNGQHDVPFGRPSEGFTLVRSSELVGPARGSRVWFPNKDSQSIASKVLPNLGIPKHGIAWKKKWHETQGPHPLQPVQPFFLSDEQRSPAVAIKQQTACSATAGFGFSHASGAPHSRGIIVMVIKSHPPDLSIYVDIHTFTCFQPSRLSTLG